MLLAIIMVSLGEQSSCKGKNEVWSHEVGKKQTGGLQAILQEVRAVSNAVHAIRRDTRNIIVHIKQLVSTVSGLTVTVNALESVLKSYSGSGPSTELVTNEEGGSLLMGGDQRSQKNTKPQLKNLFWGKMKNKSIAWL